MWEAVCVLGMPAADGGVNVAEGLDDALALAARLPWPAVSAGGRGGFFDVDLARWLPSLSAVDVWSTLRAWTTPWHWRPVCPGPPSARAAGVVSSMSTLPAGCQA